MERCVTDGLVFIGASPHVGIDVFSGRDEHRA